MLAAVWIEEMLEALGPAGRLPELSNVNRAKREETECRICIGSIAGLGVGPRCGEEPEKTLTFPS